MPAGRAPQFTAGSGTIESGGTMSGTGSKQQGTNSGQVNTPSLLLSSMTNASLLVEDSPPEIVALLNMADFTNQLDTSVGVDEPLFMPTPRQVVFSNFEPFQKYKMVLKLRNQDIFARRVKILPPGDPAISVMCSKKPGNAKCAPGMDVIYTITFTPTEDKDMCCDLICVTEREKFVVPIRAFGGKAALNFPDNVSFAPSSVRTTSSRTFLIQNVGTEDARFSLSTTTPFSVSPAEGFVQKGASCQVTLEFSPMECLEYQGDLAVQYDNGNLVYVSLFGQGQEVDIDMSSNVATMESTYVTMQSTKTVTLYNNGDTPVDFSWKLMPHAWQEDSERHARTKDIDAREAEDMESACNGTYVLADEDDIDDDGDEDLIVQMSVAAVKRTYERLRQEVGEDALAFEDPSFTILPASGVCGGNSCVEFTVSFHPQHEEQYNRSAYLQVTGRETRLPLTIDGRGVGPQVDFPYDDVDIGDVFVNSINQYEVVLANDGDIDAQYSLEDNHCLTRSKFTVTPDSGVLAAGSQQIIKVTFCSDILSDFSQVFAFDIQGSFNKPAFTFRGRVIGPTFTFDTQCLKFGTVSYGFLNSKYAFLINTSEIPMRFQLRVPADGKFLQREFDVIPSTGSILPGGRQKIQIDFISTSLRAYDVALVVDIEGVGEDLLSLPILAETVVPRVTLSNTSFDLGDVHVGQKCTIKLNMCNTSDLPAKYELVPPSARLSSLGTVTCERSKGSVSAFSEQDIKLEVAMARTGRIKLPVELKVIGSEEPAVIVNVTANVAGPSLKLDHVSLDFGKSEVLKTSTKRIMLRNDSGMETDFRCVIKNSARSPFSVTPEEGMIDAHSSIELVVSATLVDATPSKDELNILIPSHDTNMLACKLKASGTGTTIIGIEAVDGMDFGDQLTSQPFERSVFVENRGRKAQFLSWTNKSHKEALSKQKNEQRTSKDTGASRGKEVKAPEAIFTVEPEGIVIEPNFGATFTFHGFSKKHGRLSEVLECASSVSGQRANIICAPKLTANLITPLLEFSAPFMEYRVDYDSDKDTMENRQTRNITLKNVSPLKLSFTVTCGSPFYAEQGEFSVEGGESVVCPVSFDPLYQDKRVSARVEGKLQIAYHDHPQRDNILLSAAVNFPNLSFETLKVEFGCMLNDTVKRMHVNVTNTSTITAVYSWSFVQDQGDDQSLFSTNPFDISPIRNVLKPGESETVEFICSAGADMKYSARASCEVAGGPNYDIALSADSSEVRPEMDKSSIDFGNQLYNKQESQDFYIYNMGQVDFSYTVDLTTVSRLGLIEVTPSSGKIAASDRQRCTVRFLPGLPEEVDETFYITVAHFEPSPFRVTGKGIFPHLIMSLPRVDAGLYATVSNEAFGNVTGRAETASVDAIRTLRDGKKKKGESRDTLVAKAQATAGADLLPSEAEDYAVERGLSPRSPGRASTANNDDHEMFEQILVEEECDRLVLRQSVLANMELAMASEEARVRDTEERAKSAIKRGKEPTKSTSPKRPSDVLLGALKTDAIIGDYVVDFGFVMSGSVQTKKFVLSNIGDTAVNFSIDKKKLVDNGFLVEPLRVSRLPPNSPESHVEFTVTLDSSKRTEHGLVEIPMLIPLRNGPTYSCTLKAYVTQPDLSFDTEVVDFGSILLGQCRVYEVQVYNPKEIPCEWFLSRPMANDGAKDLQYFECIPNAGTLAPKQRVNVQLRFTPKEARKHSVKIPFKVSNNDKTHHLLCKGCASQYDLSFDPPFVKVPPVQPHQSGNVVTVEMKNGSNFDIEVIALDFDGNYYTDENKLEQCEGIPWDANDVLLLPPRAPGAPLDSSVEEKYVAMMARMEVEEKAREEEEARLAAEEEGEEAGEPVAAKGGSKPQTPAVSNDPDLTELDTEPPLPAPNAETVNYFLVYGPPLSGKSRQSMLLANRFATRVVTVDDIIHMLWNPSRPSMEEPGAEEGAPLSLGQRLSAALNPPPVDQEAVDAAAEAEEARAVAAGEEPSEPEIIPDPVLEGEEGLKLLSEALTEALRCDALLGGFVLDGLNTKYASDHADVAGALRDALFALKVQHKLIMVGLDLPEDEYQARLARLVETEAEAVKTAATAAAHRDYLELKLSAEDNADVDERISEEERSALCVELDDATDAADTADDAMETAKRLLEAGTLSVSRAEMYQAFSDKEGFALLVSVDPYPTSEEDASAAAGSPSDPKKKGGKPDAKAAKAAAANMEGDDEEQARQAMLSKRLRTFDANQPVTELFAALKKGKAYLPSPPEEEEPVDMTAHMLEVPPPTTYQCLHKPNRAQYVDSNEMPASKKGFRIFTVKPPPAPEDEVFFDEDEDDGDSRKKGAAVAKKGEPVEPEEDEGDPVLEFSEDGIGIESWGPYVEQGQYRWIVPANSTQLVDVYFSSSAVNSDDADNDAGRMHMQQLKFMVMGDIKPYVLPCESLCTYPTIDSSPKSVFVNKAAPGGARTCCKRLGASELAKKQYRVGAPFEITTGRFAMKQPEPVAEHAGGDAEHHADPEHPVDPEHPEAEAEHAIEMTVPEAEVFGYFDFGPMVYAASDDEEANEHNSVKLVMRNNGHFPARIEFAMESGDASRFSVDTGDEEDKLVMALEVGAERELTLKCCPAETGDLKDVIVCSIENNPEPILFPVAAYGDRPWIKAIAPVREVDEEGKEHVEEKETQTIAFERQLIGKVTTQVMALVNGSSLAARWELGASKEEFESKGFNVFPVSGEIPPLGTSTVSFTFCKTKTDPVEEGYDSPQLHEFPLKVLDHDGRCGADLVPHATQDPHSYALKVEAQAYEINCVIDPEIMATGLDFQTVRVDEHDPDGAQKGGVGAECHIVKEVTISNEGSFPVGFRFQVARKSTREMFTFKEQGTDTALEGVPEIPNGQKKVIEVHFRSHREVRLRDCQDIRLEVIELGAEEVYESKVIPVCVEAVFSKYTIQPSSGIAFGPVETGKVKVRTITIENHGKFDFNFNIADTAFEQASEDDVDAGAAAKGKGAQAKGAQAKGGSSPPSGGALTVGPYTIEPCNGTVACSSRPFEVKITYKADEVAQYVGKDIFIDFEHRDPSMYPDGLKYSLSGESCIPGIQTFAFDEDAADYIFEEQRVVATLDADSDLLNGVFGKEERLFSFGNVLIGKNRTEAFRITNPFRIPCDAVAEIKPKAPRHGQTAATPADMAFVLEEPVTLTAIATHEYQYLQVKFEPTAVQNYGATLVVTVPGGSDEKTSSLMFDLGGEGTMPHVVLTEPAQLAAGGYCVDFGRMFMDHATSRRISVRNEGVVEACVFLDPGTLSPPFLIGGDGLPVTVQPGDEHTFTLSFRPQGESASEDFAAAVRVKTENNQFESYELTLKGTGYREVVTFDGLSTPDTLDFGDCVLGVEKTEVFRVHSRTDTEYVRLEFVMPEDSDVTFTPSAAHLPPKTSLLIKAVFKPTEERSPVQYLAVGDVAPASGGGKDITPPSAQKDGKCAVQVKCSRIKYMSVYEGEMPEPDAKGVVAPPADFESVEIAAPDVPWTNLVKPTDRFEEVAPAEGADAAAAGDTASVKSEDKKRIFEPDAEPVHLVKEVEGEPDAKGVVAMLSTEKMLSLNLAGNCDKVCLKFFNGKTVPEGGASREELSRVPFASTKMYQKRSHTFQIANEGKSATPYSFVVVLPASADVSVEKGAFTVSPASGVLPAGAEVDITVTFAPEEVANFNHVLKCTCPHDEDEPFEIALTAKATRPLCHFELPVSDYLTSGRRMADAGDSAVTPDTMVIEIESLGTQVKNTKRFHVINPTNIPSYEFEWRCLDRVPVPAFKCGTRKGIVLSGKKCEMAFEFTPTGTQPLESLWEFTILRHDISVQVLLVGTVREPSVDLDQPAVNFKKHLVHTVPRETVYFVNEHHLPFAFAMDKAASTANGIMEVSPERGVVPPNGRLPLEVTFRPKEEGRVNCNFVFKVKNKPKPVTLNVKGHGYAIKEVLQLTDSDDGTGNRTVLAPGSHGNKVTFGTGNVKEEHYKTVIVNNNGDYSFDFTWAWLKSPHIKVCVERELKAAFVVDGVEQPAVRKFMDIDNGNEMVTVQPGKPILCQIRFNPQKETNLDAFKMALSITNGHSYVFNVAAAARNPAVQFSFTRMDFGPVQLWRNGDPGKKAVLRITNHEVNDVTLDCDYSTTPQLEVGMASRVLGSRESLDVPITFYAREEKSYREVIPIHVQGGHIESIEVLGEGSAANIELVNTANEECVFGSVLVGQKAHRSVKIANRSHATASFKLEHDPAAGLTVLPDRAIELGPHKTATVEIVFAPTERVPPILRLPVRVNMNDAEAEDLIYVTAQCQGLDVSLNQATVMFDNAVKNSAVTSTIQLENNGEIGTSFRWDARRMAPDFRLSPMEGYLKPNSIQILEVTFCPKKAGQKEIRVDNIACVLQGQAKPVLLTVMGSCVEIEESTDSKRDTLQFDGVAVRSRDDGKKIRVENKTSAEYVVKPSFDNPLFTGASQLVVPVGGADYEVSFSPVAMGKMVKAPAQEGQPEPEPERESFKGMLFIPLPDGSAQMYDLVGNVVEPHPEESITKEAKCMIIDSVVLPVKNWMSRTQKFKVGIEVANLTEGGMPSPLYGGSSIDVVSGAQGSYKLQVKAYKEGSYTGTVRFTDTATGEYMFFNVALTVAPSEVTDTHKLEARVRQLVSRSFSVPNPTKAPITMTLASSDPALELAAATVDVPAGGQAGVHYSWRPLQASKEGEPPLEVTVQCKSDELGLITHKFELNAVPCGPEPTKTFRVPLGSSVTQTLRFKHYSKAAADYTVTMGLGADSPFEMETVPVKALAATDNQGVLTITEIIFTPSKLGEVRDTLSLSSPLGGDYTVILAGTGMQPKPRGPLDVKNGGSIPIPVKNVFPDATTDFEFVVDQGGASFSLKENKKTLAAKKDDVLTVNYKKDGEITSGRVLVSARGVTWVIYLRGTD